MLVPPLGHTLVYPNIQSLIIAPSTTDNIFSRQHHMVIGQQHSSLWRQKKLQEITKKLWLRKPTFSSLTSHTCSGTYSAENVCSKSHQSSNTLSNVICRLCPMNINSTVRIYSARSECWSFPIHALRLHSNGILGNPRKSVKANCQSKNVIFEGNSGKGEKETKSESSTFFQEQMKEEFFSMKANASVNEDIPSSHNGSSEESVYEREAWELLKSATVYYCGNPVGTIAANDPSDHSPLNYDQVFIRDFIPSAIAFLLKGEFEIVRHFILYTLQLQVCVLTSSFADCLHNMHTLMLCCA